MVPIMALWLPIVVSAVIVFIVSAVIHMMLKYHDTDFAKLPAEDAAMDALRPLNIPPGDYMMPYGGGSEAMKSPEFKAKFNKGPVAVMTFIKAGSWTLSESLIKWFIYLLVVGVFTAYLTGRALPLGTDYLHVFRIAGCASFLAYAMAMWPDTIWYRKKWTTALKNTFDGLVYALMTAGTFGWLWPR